MNTARSPESGAGAENGARRVSSIKAALDTLALLVRSDAPSAVDLLETSGLEATAFFDLCRRHGLGPLVLDAFDRRQLASLLADRELERLELRRRRHVAAQRARLQELDRLAGVFFDAGVDCVLLKGPYLAQRFHGGVHRRAWTDLDLLIQRRDLARVHELLRGAGYGRLSTILLSDRLCARFTHAFDYARDGSRIDLHWSLGVSAAYSLDGATIWRESQAFAIEGLSRESRVLSDDHCLMALLVSFFEDLQRGAGKLKSLVDVDRVLGATRPEWPRFFERRRGEGTESPCRAVLSLYLRWLGPAADQPGLVEALGPEPAGSAAPEALLGALRGSASNRRWAARNTDASPAATMWWWVVGLPFRLAVYRPGRWKRRWRRMRARDGRLAAAGR